MEQITILNNNVPSLVVSETVMNIALGGGETETFTAEVMNDGSGRFCGEFCDVSRTRAIYE